MNKKLHILMLEDVPSDAELIEYELRKAQLAFISKRVDTREDFLKELKYLNPDLVLVDYMLPKFDGITALNLLKEHAPSLPVIVVTGSVNEETAVECMKAGAWDYVLKGHLRRMGPAVLGALEKKQKIDEKEQAEEEMRKSHERLRELAWHLESVRDEERTRIAREIHDDLGQTLTALKIRLSRLRLKLPQDQTVLVEQAGSMLGLVDKTIQTVQKISTELRPSLLDNLGFTAAAEWQIGEFQEDTGIKCDLTLDHDGVMLDNGRSTALFRILQETLTNITRHANATRVKINLKKENSKIVLEVKDNGLGITKEQISDPKSFGLIGMHERVNLWKGEFKVSGIRGNGTTVTVTIPLYKKEKRREKEL